jgi:hypothetical protein
LGKEWVKTDEAVVRKHITFQEDAEECVTAADEDEEGPKFEDHCSHFAWRRGWGFLLQGTSSKVPKSLRMSDWLGEYFGEEDSVCSSEGAQDAIESRHQKAAANQPNGQKIPFCRKYRD